jgi:uncharacterized protein with von Willebrand factor type A (vWA) domain
MATNLWDRVDEVLSGFIHFGKVFTREQRRALARKLSLYLYEPTFDPTEELNLAKWESQYPNWFPIIQQLFEQKELRELSGHNEDLALSISANLLNWLHKTARNLEIGQPHTDELRQHRSWSQQPESYELTQWQELMAQLLQDYPENQKDWSFYATRLQEETTPSRDTDDLLASRQSLSVLWENILEDWGRLLLAKKSDFEQSYLKEAFSQHQGLLQQRIDQLNFLGEMLEPFYRHLGELWNTGLPAWNQIPWDQVETYVAQLKKDPNLKKLAEMLGRWQMVELEREEEKRERAVPKKSWKPNPFGKSEVIGIHYSDDLGATLPSEIALLSHRDTELLFSKKFVEHKLLSFQYRSQDASSEPVSQEETIRQPKVQERGPLILVMDTSGSMFGRPELVAKAIGFVVVSQAIQKSRPCYLITFSTDIHTLEMTEADKSWDRLLEFLCLSFHGGTDLQPALRKVMKKLRDARFEKADVLIISDFLIPAVEEKVRQEIQHQRLEKGTQFHSLYIAHHLDPGAVPVTIFDHHWVYDLDNPQVIRQTMDNLEELG